jgi:pyridinium-3,5-biscarboxylic acid mononucleotide synthase
MSAAEGRSPELRRLLEELVTGEATLDETLQKLRLHQVVHLGDFARLDTNRDLRKGVPEVIYASRKSDADLEAIVRCYLAEKGYALATRLGPERADTLRRTLTGAPEGGRGPVAGLTLVYQERAGTLAAYTSDYRPPEEGGCVGLLTAGTSDIPVAEEAALMITHMGCRLEKGYDTGVAGLHRLAEPLTRMLEGGADVLVVVAGMEGALPSVVAGLVDVPVIGVPTSTGYGLGGDGTAALYSILQSCSPGLLAVNIDNGVGAGAAAALIARGRKK